jgi:hypothetical protein
MIGQPKMMHKKRVRLAALESELTHLESLPEVLVRTGPRRRKKMPHTARQFRRIEALQTTHIPKARQRVEKK